VLYVHCPTQVPRAPRVSIRPQAPPAPARLVRLTRAARPRLRLCAVHAPLASPLCHAMFEPRPLPQRDQAYTSRVLTSSSCLSRPCAALRAGSSSGRACRPHAPRGRINRASSACAGATGATGPCGAFTCVNSTNLLCYTTAANGTTGANNLCADPRTGYCVNETSARRASRSCQARDGLVVLAVGRQGYLEPGALRVFRVRQAPPHQSLACSGRLCMRSVRQEAGRLAAQAV